MIHPKAVLLLLAVPSCGAYITPVKKIHNRPPILVSYSTQNGFGSSHNNNHGTTSLSPFYRTTRTKRTTTISYMTMSNDDKNNDNKKHLNANPALHHRSSTNNNTLQQQQQQQQQPTDEPISRRTKLKQHLKKFATKISPIKIIAPQAIAELLTDATVSAVEESKIQDKLTFTKQKVGKVLRRRALSKLLEEEAALDGETALSMDTIALAKTAAADAFDAAESSIMEAEGALLKSKEALAACKVQVGEMIAVAEQTAMEANLASMQATALAATAALNADTTSSDDDDIDVVDKDTIDTLDTLEEDPSITMTTTSTTTKATTSKEISTMENNTLTTNNNPTTPETITQTETTTVNLTQESMDISTLSYEDIDYHLSEMAPPFLDSSMCLIPGEPIVRVERAPSNSRRIFAGIDIMSSVDAVWDVLTDYNNLQNVIPNLVVNEVLERYQSDVVYPFSYEIRTDVKSEEQCRALSTRMKGATMRQVGGAKVVGINFSARTTLEVREWPQGMPDFFHFSEDVYDGKSRMERAKKEVQAKLERYHFPRPFAISELPTRDISMQSIENDDGEFRLYQGVWRMQPLPGCSPADGSSEAMRLTYAVEISPRPYLPVGLIEGRITQDLCNNLIAIRDYVTEPSFVQEQQQKEISK